MAERRMFAKSTISSARFLRMPSTSRLLYYDLGMQADDEGIVEAFTVMRTTGATEDDLRVLVSKGFVVILNEDLVAYIVDWNRNNLLKKDRFHPSIYRELLIRVTDGTQVEHSWNQSGNQAEPEYSILYSSILDSNESKVDKPPRTASKPERHKFGQYGWVKLSDDEYNRLSSDLGENEVKRCITYLDESAQSTGNKNKWRDWNLVIRRCSREGWGKRTADTRNTLKTAADYDRGEDFFS